MSTFNMLGIAATGVTVHQKWLDAVSDNIANVNNVSRTAENAFQARYVIAQAAPDGNGAQVGGIAFGSAEGRLVYEPDHPLADADGYVRARHRPRQPDEPADHGAARLPGQPLRSSTDAQDSYTAPSSSGSA